MPTKNDYVFLLKKHRNLDPKNPSYEKFEKYCDRMLKDHGLEYDPLCPIFEFNKNLTSFRIVDSGKAFIFAMEFPEFIVKP